MVNTRFNSPDKKYLKLLIPSAVIIYIISTLISCNPATKQQQESRDITDPVIHEISGEGTSSKPLSETDSSVTFKVFQNEPNEGSGFGYDIYVGGKRYIHQPNIPAVAGNRGFSTEGDARKTAELMAYKIKHKIMPPSVSVQELDSIGVK